MERNEENDEVRVSPVHNPVRNAQAEQATFYAFDCLGIKGQNCMQAPFHIRYKVSMVLSTAPSAEKQRLRDVMTNGHLPFFAGQTYSQQAHSLLR